MTTNHKRIRITAHAEQRRQERRITTESVHQAVTDGQQIRTADGWRLIGRDGTHVITDPTATVVITVLGRFERTAHDRDGAGLSRFRPTRPGTRTDRRGPRR